MKSILESKKGDFVSTFGIFCLESIFRSPVEVVSIGAKYITLKGTSKWPTVPGGSKYTDFSRRFERSLIEKQING